MSLQHYLGKYFAQLILCILGKVWCIAENVSSIFGGTFVYSRKYFIHDFWKHFVYFKNVLRISKDYYFVIQKNLWCKSGNILCIIKERFCVLKKTFGIFFEKRFCAFCRETLCDYGKDFVYFSKHFLYFEKCCVFFICRPL